MKSLISLSLLILIAGSAGAASSNAVPGLPETRLACATMPLTTSYVLTESPDFFELSVLHHNGTRSMPIFDGIVTPRGLERLQELSRLYEQMGDVYRVRFDKSRCKIEGGEWVCSKREPMKLGGLEVESVWFTVEKRRVVTRFVDYTAEVARFLFTKDRTTHHLSMEYGLSDCIKR